MGYNFTSKKITVQNNGEYTFDFRGHDENCRDGYNQFGDLVLLADGNPCGHATSKNHIVNRSWEAYDHQSVYIGCVNQILEYRKTTLKKQVLSIAGKVRMTKALEPKLEKAIEYDKICVCCERALKELHNV